MDGVFRCIAGCGVRQFLGVWHVYAGSCAGGRGCYFLLAIVHQRCLLQDGCVLLSKQQQFPLAWLCFWFCCCLYLQDLLWWFCWTEGGRLELQHTEIHFLCLYVIQLPPVKALSFQLGAFSSSKSFCCIGWEGTWLCNVSLMSPIFAFITVILEPLGSLHIFCRLWQYPFSWRF